MGLRFDPMGGGQFQAAVKKMLEIERQPIKSLESKKEIQEKKMKLFQDFKSKFSGFQKMIDDIATPRKFRELKADVGDGGNLCEVVLDKDVAEPGSHTVEIVSLPRKASLITNGVLDPDKSKLGTGWVTIYMPDGNDFEVYIDDNSSSLRGIAKAINNDDKAPVKASVVRDDNDLDAPWRLVITSKNLKPENSDIEFADFYFMGGDENLYIDEDRYYNTGSIKFDDYEIGVSSNEIQNFVPGVTLKIKQARPDQPFNLTISTDTKKMASKMKTIVDQMNQILEFINKQNQMDDKTDTKSTFGGDTSLVNIEYRIRNLMHEGFQVTDPKDEEGDPIFLHAHEMGLEFDKGGKIKFDEEKFQNQLENRTSQIIEGISDEMGFAYQLKVVMDGYSRPFDGLLALKERALRERIKAIDDQIAQKEIMYEKKEKNLVEKFSRLQGSLSSMQRQQAALSSMGGGGGGGNIVSQLLGGGG